MDEHTAIGHGLMLALKRQFDRVLRFLREHGRNSRRARRNAALRRLATHDLRHD
jgi:hypothetical protein